MPSAGAWMGANLATQGYCLSEEERRQLSLGLRFSTGVCVVAWRAQGACLVGAAHPPRKRIDAT